MATTSLWDSLSSAVDLAPESNAGLWNQLGEKVNPAHYVPVPAPGVVVSHLTGSDGDYYVLKNPETKTYYRLSARDYFVWQYMDGTRTVKDLVVAYFVQYGSFAFARVAALVQGLKASLLLNDRPVNVYHQVREQLERRRPSSRLARLAKMFMEKQFAVSGLDRILTSVYRWGGWILFTWPLQALYLLVTMLGLYCFVQALGGSGYGVVTIAGDYRLGLVGLLVAELAAIFVHEMAHALTVKHYGREMRRGGFMIYFGMPAFFMDTMDIWLEPKRARLAVTWAGPYSGLILGGLASIVIALWPAFGLNALLFQFAFLCYLMVFFNLNPLLELDGYYLLMDWLEIPLLRRKSLAFIRSGLWAKLKELRTSQNPARGILTSFSREEKIFSVFGLLSAIWTGYAICSAAYFWQARMAQAVSSLWAQGGDVARTLLALIGLALSLPFVLAISLALLSLARMILNWASRQGLFRSWNLAIILTAAAVFLTFAPGYLGYPALLPFIGLTALAAASFFAWRTAVDYAGSRFAPAFWLLGLLPLALFMRLTLLLVEGEVRAATLDWYLLSPDTLHTLSMVLGYLAYASLFLACLLLFAGMNLKDLSHLEKALLALGLAISYGVVLLMTNRQQQPVGLASAEGLFVITSALVPLLALTLLIPTLFSFWSTSFVPAWITIALALGGLLGTALAGSSPFLSYLLLAAGLYLHHAIYDGIALVVTRPEGPLGLSDRDRLRQAFAYTGGGIYDQLCETGGKREACDMERQFNNYALAAGWQVQMINGLVEDALPRDLSLSQGGDCYAAALNLMLDLMIEQVGGKMTVRALQRAYDGLPWEGREIAAQYLFPYVKRAEALSREFQSIQQNYRALLRRIPLFSTMDETEIDLLCSCLKIERFKPGRVIIRQRDPGDRFYIVKHGHVEVTVRDAQGVSEIVNELNPGDYFGQLALLRDVPRNATCRSTVPTEVLSLSRSDFDRLVRARFALREKIDYSITRADLLRRMPIFADLNAQQVQAIVAQLQEESHEPGTVIIHQDEIGETFYVIESGHVQATVRQAGIDQVVAERGPGEYVGEIALLLQVPRTATVRALTPVRLLALHRHDFDHLVANHLYVNRRLERDTSRRMIDLQRTTRAA